MLCNSLDESFIELRFDGNSLQFFTEVLIKKGFIGDPLTGLLVWDGLYAMMRHGSQGMTPDKFLKAVISALEFEQEDDVFFGIIAKIDDCLFSHVPGPLRQGY